MEKTSQEVSSSSRKGPVHHSPSLLPSLVTVLEGAMAAVRGTESNPSLRCLQPGWHSPSQLVSHMQTKPSNPPSHTSQEQGGQELMQQMQPEPLPSPGSSHDGEEHHSTQGPCPYRDGSSSQLFARSQAPRNWQVPSFQSQRLLPSS